MARMGIPPQPHASILYAPVLEHVQYPALGYGYPYAQNAAYGAIPGAQGLGAVGCNGVNNPQLFGPPPWAMRQALPPWASGIGPGWGRPQAPYALPPGVIGANGVPYGGYRPGGLPRGLALYLPAPEAIDLVCRWVRRPLAEFRLMEAC